MMEYGIIPKQMVLSILCITSVFLQISAITVSDKIYFPDEVPSVLDKLGSNGDEIRNRFSYISEDDFCEVTPGELGHCIPYNQCPPLVQFVAQNGQQNPNTINYLRKRICRYFRNNAYLCCPLNIAGLLADHFFPRRPNDGPSSLLPSAASVSSNPAIHVKPNNGASSFLPSQDECGLALGDRIVGGREISPGSHPWLVGIGVPRPTPSFRVLCGGTLITRKHVLTASHCFSSRAGLPRITHVILGEHSLSRKSEREQPMMLRISRRTSPGYNPSTQINDLEIITMVREVEFTSYIRPVCLPFGLRDIDIVGQEMTIIGWGDRFFGSNAGSDVPLSTNITVRSKAVCRAAYIKYPEIPFDRTQICAARGSSDACQGDSGGPLIYMEQVKYRRYFLMGIVSFGVECGNPDFPGVYTYVPEFLDFISRNIR